MQDDVAELTRRLLRSLDKSYNVINMPEVIDIVSLLEKVSITKELLETTRLGKYVNELRRKTANESLSKRAKELVKKWRSICLPESNGQLKTTVASSAVPPLVDPDDSCSNQSRTSVTKKRPASSRDSPPGAAAKRPKLNGQASELDFSDNSNSSFKEAFSNRKNAAAAAAVAAEPAKKRAADVIVINSDSNSSLPEVQAGGAAPQVDQQQPKKRGRKKGSTNHRKLVDEAESSFTNKLAVSRGNSKVKTTQELIASLQNKNCSSAATTGEVWSPTGTPVVKREDLNERAAKLTERVSIIDQKLNTNCGRFKNNRKRVSSEKKNVLESGRVVNDREDVTNHSSNEEEIIVVDDLDRRNRDDEIKTEAGAGDGDAPAAATKLSLSIEEALAQLPPIDKSVLLDEPADELPHCTCYYRSGDETGDEEPQGEYEPVEDPECPAKAYLQEKYRLGFISEERVRNLHRLDMPEVNGNYSLGDPRPGPPMTDDGLYVNVVPNVNSEALPRDFTGENYKRYSISDDGERTEGREEGQLTFREWHEVIERPSHDGQVLRILPYVIID